MVRTMATYGPSDERCSGVSGLDGSHGRSHDAFRTRISRHVRASDTRTGRNATGASRRSGSVRVAGHPRIRPTAVNHSPERRFMPCDLSVVLTLCDLGGTVRIPARSGALRAGVVADVIAAADLVHRVHEY